MRWVLVALLVGCTGVPEAPRVRGKPRAPVDVTVEARAVGGDRWEVTVEGTATADVESLSVELVTPGGTRATRGERTASGGSRRLVTEVVAPAGTEVRGVARTPVGPQAVTARLGGVAAAKALVAPAERVVITPFGPVAEAR